MNAIKTLLASVLAAGALYGTAQAGNIEVMSTEKGATIDAKVAGSIVGDLGLFMRNRLSVDYQNDNAVGSFTVIDATYPIGAGFDIVTEGQLAPGAPLDTRIGVQCFRALGDATVYALATRSLQNPNTEIVVKGKYTPTITGDFKGLLQWESLLNMGDDATNFAIQRVRAGADYKGTEAGLAVDAFRPGDAETEYSIGGFVSTSF
jgi:hypothetical protein